MNKVIKWVNSKEGQLALKESQERAEKACKELRDNMKVDIKTLLIPVTI